MPLAAAPPDENYQRMLEAMDISYPAKPFRNPNWKAPPRRNKNIKQILTEASRKEASIAATQNNSGASTPQTHQNATPNPQDSRPANIAQAAQNLSTLVLEKNLRNATGTVTGTGPTGPSITYTNIESAPSLHPGHQKRYCDITGLPAPYTDPKTRLRYHDKEVFEAIRNMGQGSFEKYLEARGAHTILK